MGMRINSLVWRNGGLLPGLVHASGTENKGGIKGGVGMLTE